jgi:hypothetical protein
MHSHAPQQHCLFVNRTHDLFHDHVILWQLVWHYCVEIYACRLTLAFVLLVVAWYFHVLCRAASSTICF